MVIINESLNDEVENEKDEDLLDRYHEYLSGSTITDIQDQIDEEIPKFELFNQIENTFSNDVVVSTKDLFGYFADRYQYAHKNLQEDTDRLNDVDEDIREICFKAIDLIQEIYYFELNFDNVKTGDLVDYTNGIYKFFILGYKQFLINFGYNYTLQNLTALEPVISSYEKHSYDKNLSYEVLKTQINNKYTSVIYFLEDVLGNLTIDDGEDVIKLMFDEDSETYEEDIIKQVFLQGEDQDGLVNYDVRFVSHISDITVRNQEIYQTIRGKLIRTLKKSTEGAK